MDCRGTGTRVERALAHGAVGATLPPGLAEDDGVATSRDGRWTVVLGALPTNTRTLRVELRARGLVEEGSGAAGLAAAIVAEIGFTRMIERLDGPVPVAAVDGLDGSVWLARDRVGLYPLHYAHVPGGLVWASDLAAMGAWPEVDRGLSREGVASLVVRGMVPAPGTVWRGVAKLGAGTLLHGDIARWWDAGVHPDGAGGARSAWARSVRYATELAVRQHVDEGAFVAHGGGAFSGAVRQLSGARPLTGTMEEVPDLGEPVASPAAVVWCAMARRAWEEGVPLATGLGGPEGFHPRARARPYPLPLPRGFDPRTLFEAEADAPIVELEAPPSADPAAAESWVRRRHLLPERELAAAERACAAHGVRLVAPLADARLQALACSIPVEHHRHRGPRSLFVEAMLGSAPPPSPFTVPAASWLRGMDLSRLPETLGAVVNPDRLRWEVERLHAGDDSQTARLWAEMVLDRWLRAHG